MGLVCRLLEEHGIATAYVATGRDLTALVKPPRALFVNHPMGNNFGAAGDADMQRDVLRAALAMIHRIEQGGTLLEIGPGTGGFAFLAKRAGFDVRVIEMDQECCDFIEGKLGIEVLNEPETLGETGGDSFDAIAMWHVL